MDATYANYFDNWFNQMDLICVPPSKYMALGSVFYLSAGISGILFGGLAESMGRKKTVFTLQAISSAAQLLILFIPNYWIRIACFLVLGTSQLKNG
jgi:MFS family permease